MRHESFETPGELTLEVRVPAGRIEIEAVEGTTTEVELDVRGGEEAVELLEEARIELRESRGGHEVVVEVEDGRWSRFWRRLDVRLRIQAPEGANLRVSTASADLRARGRFGWFEAEAASGDMEVDHISGNATAKAASGDLNLASVARWGAAQLTETPTASEKPKPATAEH